jgi:predicted O-methyltransferase YrrM
MRTVDISLRLLSEAVWKRILEASAYRLAEKRQSFFEIMASLESLRRHAEYDTGSISTASAWILYAVSHYFRPERILEVGTFIGRSAIALAMGSEDAGSSVELHTCDMSNMIELPRVGQGQFRQYPRTSSTAMFTKILSDRKSERRFDLLNLDGRLQDEDFALLERLCSPDVIVALDDFEGTEKGVVNLINLRNRNFLSSHLLIYPCSEPLLRQFGFCDHSTTALLLPQAQLRLTAQ